MYLEKKNSLKNSIRMQVICWYVGVLATVIVCCVLLMQIGFSKLCSFIIKNNLKNTAILASYEIKVDKSRLIDGLQLEIANDDVVVIYDADGEAIYESRNTPDEIKNIELSDGIVQYMILKGKSVYVYDTLQQIDEGEPIWIRSYVSFNNSFVIDKAIFLIVFITIPIALLGAVIGGILITKKIFQPINQLYDTAKEISESIDMTKRIPVKEGQDDEISRLSQMFNNMFERLEDSFEKERQFTMDASHELRTPLTVIRTQAEYLEHYFQENSKEDKAMGTILKQTKYMSRMVNSLLFIARMENNADIMQVEDVDISELALIVSEEMQETAAEKEITILLEVEEGVKIQADQGMIVRVFMNLISNAIQYGKKGGFIKVTLKKAAGRVEIEIEDNGIGISKEHISKIWNRFYQVDATGKKNGNSMGLGLFMVRKIIEMHNGSIMVKSELGEGTKFIFFL